MRHSWRNRQKTWRNELSEECTCAQVSGGIRESEEAESAPCGSRRGGTNRRKQQKWTSLHIRGISHGLEISLGYLLRTKFSSTGSGRGQTSLSLVRLETFTKAEAGISNLS